MNKAIAYIRTSSEKQHKSGLGAEAQINQIAAFIKSERYELIETYHDGATSGKIAPTERIGLAAALKQARETGATIIVSKLCRLSRELVDVADLMRQGVDFRVVQYPQAPTLLLHIIASMNQYEREMISQRTKEALQVAKSKGVKLGTDNPKVREGINAKGRKVAHKYLPHLLECIATLQEQGIKPSTRKIAKILTEKGLETSRGSTKWTHSSVAMLLKRNNIKL